MHVPGGSRVHNYSVQSRENPCRAKQIARLCGCLVRSYALETGIEQLICLLLPYEQFGECALRQGCVHELCNGNECDRKGMVQGRALLDHESSDEREMQVEVAVEQPKLPPTQVLKKKKTRGRTRGERKAKKAAKIAADLQSLGIKKELMES
jgi:hypothetical protein